MNDNCMRCRWDTFYPIAKQNATYNNKNQQLKMLTITTPPRQQNFIGIMINYNKFLTKTRKIQYIEK
jgi:hypothetical protein